MLYVVQFPKNDRFAIVDVQTPNIEGCWIYGTLPQTAEGFALAKRFLAGIQSLGLGPNPSEIFHALGYDGWRRDMPGTAIQKSLDIMQEFGW